MGKPEAEITRLQDVLGHTFSDINILIEALTHKSFHYENPDESPFYNERLEFLGDSVLGVSVASYLFRHESGLSESMMAKVKSYVVKGEVISEIADNISLGEYLFIGRGEEDTGGRMKPSLLTNALEAVIGAVFYDGGPLAAKETVLRLFKDRLDEVIASGEFHDYKTEFQESCQERMGATPQYRVVSEDGLEHNKVFTVEVTVKGDVMGIGTGTSKKKAEQAAARLALESFPEVQE